MQLPQVFKNFVNSEKAVAVGLLIIGATVLVAVGKLDISTWVTYTRDLAAIYVGGKAIQGAAVAIATGQSTSTTAGKGGKRHAKTGADSGSEVTP